MAAFDPNLPAENSPLDSQQMRDQFASLKTLIDQHPTTLDVDAMINSETAVNVDAIQPLLLAVSNPPTQVQMQAIVAKLNELIGALQH
jgi:hypothetical protein